MKLAYVFLSLTYLELKLDGSRMKWVEDVLESFLQDEGGLCSFSVAGLISSAVAAATERYHFLY